jgi:photosystem II stability/assembly factor-like uncharacterized protein
MIKALKTAGAVPILLGALVSMGRTPGHAVPRPGVRLARVSTLPPECRDGCSLTMIGPTSGWLQGRTALWATTDSGASWQYRTVPGTRVIGDFAAMHFVDGRRGWLLTVSQQLYETLDGAISWRLVSPPRFDGVVQAAWLSLGDGISWLGGGVYKPGTSPDAPNYAVKENGAGGWSVLHPTVFIKHGTGTWDQQDLPKCSWQVDGIRFWDAKRGFAFGDGCFYYTDSGGKSWRTAVFPARSGLMRRYPGEGGHPTIFFLDRTNGWLGLDDGSLYRTSDGGEHWSRIASSKDLRFSALRFLDQLLGLGVASGSKLVQTRDGGRSWHSVNVGFWPRALDSLGGRSGWVVSDDALYTFAFE